MYTCSYVYIYSCVYISQYIQGQDGELRALPRRVFARRCYFIGPQRRGGAGCVAGAGAASGDVCDFPPKLDDFPPTRAEERAALLEELARSQAGVDPALQA